MLICRCPGQRDVRLVVGTFVDDFAGRRYLGVPYIDGDVMTKEFERDALGRAVRRKLSYRHGTYSDAGLFTVLQLMIDDVNDARRVEDDLPTVSA